ncbi:hypothetical protein MPSEU_000599500 [Mayamaea pseudoterrestris]|nr:hypothetical protein MPSEU_000599500 [Mayamaea pseudoterrestris]
MLASLTHRCVVHDLSRGLVKIAAPSLRRFGAGQPLSASINPPKRPRKSHRKREIQTDETSLVADEFERIETGHSTCLQSTVYRHGITSPPLITCQPGLETILSDELSALDVPHVKTHQRHVIQAKAPMNMDQLLKCHLYLGTATHILLPLHNEPFMARGMHQLQRKLERLPWQEVFRAEHMGFVDLQIKVTASKSKLMHTKAVSDCIRRAVHTCLGCKEDDGQAPIPGLMQQSATTPVVLQVSVDRDIFRIALQSSPTPLHRRGYRLQTAKAPLREDLAFAMLYASNWIPASRIIQEEPFYNGLLDPLCGSGTIPIEAAAMASCLPPGRLRPPPFEGTRLHDNKLWSAKVADALERSNKASKNSSISIFGSDRDSGAIDVARANAERAGVLHMIDFAHCAISSQPLFENPADAPSRLLVATNLPFGRRISSTRSASRNPSRKFHPMLPLYQTLANKVQKFNQSGSNASAMMLVHDRLLAQQGFHGLDIETKMQTSHGGLQVLGIFSSTKI